MPLCVESDTSLSSLQVHEHTEAVNLLYFARYQLKYLSQFAEYNCNQGVLRKVILSSETYLF